MDENFDPDRWDLEPLRKYALAAADWLSTLIDMARKGLLVPCGVGVVFFFVFRAEVAMCFLIPATLFMVVASFGGAVIFAVWVGIRRKSRELALATGAVVDTAVLIRNDLSAMRGGSTEVPSRLEVAKMVIDKGLLPMMSEAASASMPGPFGVVAGRLVWIPERIIKKSVFAVLKLIPDDSSLHLELEDGAMEAQIEEMDGLIDSALTDEMGTYQELLESTVALQMNRLVRPVALIGAVSMIPALIVFLITNAVA